VIAGIQEGIDLPGDFLKAVIVVWIAAAAAGFGDEKPDKYYDKEIREGLGLWLHTARIREGACKAPGDA